MRQPHRFFSCTRHEGNLQKHFTDAHVHLAAVPDGRNGCLLSRHLRNSPIFRFIVWQLGIDLSDPVSANRIYLQKLTSLLSLSQNIKAALILAVDGVYDAVGRLDESKTDFLISNDFVLSTAKAGPDMFLAGVSVNPKRRDALDEIERCAAAGAQVVKVLPNTQLFDPASTEHVPYYQALARHKLPLLSHIGYEFTLLGKDQSAGEPLRLRRALDEGVTVIAAHGGGIGLPFSGRYFDDMLFLFEKYPNFYADTSSVTLPHRRQTIGFFKRHPEIHSRLLFGTDYPIPVLALNGLGYAPLGKVLSAKRVDNPFDRQFELLRDCGVNFADFGKMLRKTGGSK